MTTQWQYFLKNLGEWEGSFTSFSPSGEELSDTPSLLSLVGENNNEKIRLSLKRFPSGQPPQELVLEYTSIGNQILFFNDGCFCQASLQRSPFSQFGGELALIAGSRRLRQVQLFDSNGKFDQLTLIREKLVGSDTPEQPPLTIDSLLGEWVGEAITIYPDFRSVVYPTKLKVNALDSHHISQEVCFTIDDFTHTITSTAHIEGSILKFENSDQPVQILLLPDGASCNTPIQIKAGHDFILEAGWLVSPELRYRMIRSYNSQGSWNSLTLVKEKKISTNF